MFQSPILHLTDMSSSEFAFPSLASILPFLEEALTGKPQNLVVSTAISLEEYAALWIKSHDSYGSCLIAMASESGETNYFPPATVKAKNEKYFLFLIPRSWLEVLKISQEFATRILATRSGKRTWTVNRETSFG